MSQPEDLKAIEQELFASDGFVALSGLHRRISEERAAFDYGDEYAEDNIGELERQLALIDTGDTNITIAAAERERTYLTEAAFREELKQTLEATPCVPASYEQAEAFSGLYNDLIGLAELLGHRVMAYGEHEAGFTTMDETVTPFNGVSYVPNASSLITKVENQAGQLRRGEGVVLDDGIMQPSGRIAHFDIWDGAGSHPATIFCLYANQNVEVLRRNTANDGIDAEGYEINLKHDTVSVGWLSADKMESFRQVVAAAEIQ